MEMKASDSSMITTNASTVKVSKIIHLNVGKYGTKLSKELVYHFYILV